MNLYKTSISLKNIYLLKTKQTKSIYLLIILKHKNIYGISYMHVALLIYLLKCKNIRSIRVFANKIFSINNTK